MIDGLTKQWTRQVNRWTDDWWTDSTDSGLEYRWRADRWTDWLTYIHVHCTCATHQYQKFSHIPYMDAWGPASNLTRTLHIAECADVLQSSIPWSKNSNNCKSDELQINWSKLLSTHCFPRGKNILVSLYRLDLRLNGTTLIEWMDLGMHIWHPPQILQERMTSSPSWQRRERAWDRYHQMHSLIFDYY